MGGERRMTLGRNFPKLECKPHFVLSLFRSHESTRSRIRKNFFIETITENKFTDES